MRDDESGELHEKEKKEMNSVGIKGIEKDHKWEERE